MNKLSEKELAQLVVCWLENDWEVYQEVRFGPGIADIVAVDKHTSWVIEVKNSFSFAVLAQAWHWIKHSRDRFVNRVSVAVPRAKNWKNRTFAEAVAREFGIGVLYVSAHSVFQMIEPKREETSNRDIRKVLCEEHKTHAQAGSQGGYWTEFKATCKAAREFIQTNPGCTGRELANGIKHHYASNTSARSSLVTWAKEGKLPGIVLVDSKRPARFYIKQQKGDV